MIFTNFGLFIQFNMTIKISNNWKPSTMLRWVSFICCYISSLLYLNMEQMTCKYFQWIDILVFAQIGTEPSDNQYLVVDIGLAAVPIIMIGNCGPHSTLVKQKPSRHLLSFIPLFSIISFLFFQALCYVGVWFYLHTQPWYVSFFLLSFTILFLWTNCLLMR